MYTRQTITNEKYEKTTNMCIRVYIYIYIYKPTFIYSTVTNITITIIRNTNNIWTTIFTTKTTIRFFSNSLDDYNSVTRKSYVYLFEVFGF